MTFIELLKLTPAEQYAVIQRRVNKWFGIKPPPPPDKRKECADMIRFMGDKIGWPDDVKEQMESLNLNLPEIDDDFIETLHAHLRESIQKYNETSATLGKDFMQTIQDKHNIDTTGIKTSN